MVSCCKAQRRIKGTRYVKGKYSPHKPKNTARHNRTKGQSLNMFTPTTKSPAFLGGRRVRRRRLAITNTNATKNPDARTAHLKPMSGLAESLLITVRHHALGLTLFTLPANLGSMATPAQRTNRQGDATRGGAGGQDTLSKRSSAMEPMGDAAYCRTKTGAQSHTEAEPLGEDALPISRCFCRHEHAEHAACTSCHKDRSQVPQVEQPSNLRGEVSRNDRANESKSNTCNTTTPRREAKQN